MAARALRTVGSYDFHSRNFKSRVSNPTYKYMNPAFVSGNVCMREFKAPASGQQTNGLDFVEDWLFALLVKRVVIIMIIIWILIIVMVVLVKR